MAAVPPFSDLSIESVPDAQRGWVEGLHRNLNEFAKGTVAGLNKALTFGDNMSAQVFTFTVNVPSDVVLISKFLNGWSALTGFQAPAYRIRPDGELESFGGLTGGSSGSAAFTVAASLAPTVTRQWGCGVWTGAAPGSGLMKVDASGNFIPTVSSNNQVFLDGVRYMPGTPAPYVASCFPVQVRYTLQNPPKGVWLWNCADISGPAPVNLGLTGSIDWQYSSATQRDSNGNVVAQLKIRNIPGLIPNKKFSVTIVAVSG